MRHKEIITDADLDAAWGHANFGSIPRREVIKDTLAKVLAGYGFGRTAKAICQELGLLIADRNRLTAKGRRYLGEVILEEAQMNASSLEQEAFAFATWMDDNDWRQTEYEGKRVWENLNGIQAPIAILWKMYQGSKKTQE